MLELVFLRPDEFEIGLSTWVGTCESTVFKTISIGEVESNERENGEGRVSDQKEEEANLSVFPNPTSDHLVMNLSVSSEERVEVLLYPISGYPVLKSEVLEGSKQYVLRWDMSTIQPGVHTLSYRYRNHTYSKKIVVIK